MDPISSVYVRSIDYIVINILIAHVARSVTYAQFEKDLLTV